VQGWAGLRSASRATLLGSTKTRLRPMAGPSPDRGLGSRRGGTGMRIRGRRGMTPVVATLTRAVAALGLLLGIVALAPTGPATAADGGVVDLTGAVPNAFTVSTGVGTVTITGVAAGDHLTLLDPATNRRQVTLFADDHGQAHFAYIPDTYVAFAT